MRIIIIEDEIVAVKNLQLILKDISEDIEVVEIFDSIKDAVNYLKKSPEVDLLFLDIQLSDGISFEIFSQVDINIPAIFVTAYDYYAIEAFKINSIDYILKPVRKEDIELAINKYKNLNQNDSTSYSLKVNEAIKSELFLNTLLIPYRDKLMLISVDNILFFYTKNEKTVICTSDGQNYNYDKTLDYLMQKLNKNNFFRANRQFIISRQSIKDINIWFGSRLSINLVVPMSERIIISKAKVPDFKTWISYSY